MVHHPKKAFEDLGCPNYTRNLNISFRLHQVDSLRLFKVHTKSCLRILPFCGGGGEHGHSPLAAPSRSCQKQLSIDEVEEHTWERCIFSKL